MAVEIERKFLVDGDFKATATGVTVIRQGYICVQTGKTVRVRLLRSSSGPFLSPTRNGFSLFASRA